MTDHIAPAASFILLGIVVPLLPSAAGLRLACQVDVESTGSRRFEGDALRRPDE